MSNTEKNERTGSWGTPDENTKAKVYSDYDDENIFDDIEIFGDDDEDEDEEEYYNDYEGNDDDDDDNDNDDFDKELAKVTRELKYGCKIKTSLVEEEMGNEELKKKLIELFRYSVLTANDIFNLEKNNCLVFLPNSSIFVNKYAINYGDVSANISQNEYRELVNLFFSRRKVLALQAIEGELDKIKGNKSSEEML